MTKTFYIIVRGESCEGYEIMSENEGFSTFRKAEKFAVDYVKEYNKKNKEYTRLKRTAALEWKSRYEYVEIIPITIKRGVRK